MFIMYHLSIAFGENTRKTHDVIKRRFFVEKSFRRKKYVLFTSYVSGIDCIIFRQLWRVVEYVKLCSLELVFQRLHKMCHGIRGVWHIAYPILACAVMEIVGGRSPWSELRSDSEIDLSHMLCDILRCFKNTYVQLALCANNSDKVYGTRIPWKAFWHTFWKLFSLRFNFAYIHCHVLRINV